MLTSEQIEAAVEWWTKAIRAPKFDALGEDERDPALEMASVMARMAVSELTDMQVRVFANALRSTLVKFEPGTYTANLSCDYNPDQRLALAAKQADIPFMNFPWKTLMRFEGGGVQVSCGYSAPVEELIDLQVG